MRSKMALLVTTLFFTAAATIAAQAAEPRHFSFAYDQPHTTAYGIAADTFAGKLQELSKGTMIIDQFPGAQLGQEPQVLQKLRTGDVDFAITSTANSATVQPENRGCFRSTLCSARKTISRRRSPIPPWSPPLRK